MPRRTVVVLTPATSATARIPPWPSNCASVANARRCWRSFNAAATSQTSRRADLGPRSKSPYQVNERRTHKNILILYGLREASTACPAWGRPGYHGDARPVRLSHLGLRPGERFSCGYNFVAG